MLSHVTIAVDAMGGDHAPSSVVEGAVAALRESACSVILVGDEPTIRRELERWPGATGDAGGPADGPPRGVVLAAPGAGRLQIVHAEEVVGMDEPPVTPIRKKRRSSIRLCADLVREGRAHGMFSAGNTGAVMIVAKMVIGTIDGVDRPALAAVMPSQGGFTLVLDVGANVDTKVEHLRQFAVMGHFYAQEILHTPAPRIGLLSIGEEQGKGTDFTRQVFKIMESLRLNFVGNVEGRDVFRGSVDVIVCDGFVGNVMLKSSEALAEMIARMLETEMSRSWRTKLGYLFAKPAFRSLIGQLDYSEYGAAPLLGVKGGCFIGHGVSNAKAVKNAILRSREFCEAELHKRMGEKIAEMRVFEQSLESSRSQEVV